MSINDYKSLNSQPNQIIKTSQDKEEVSKIKYNFNYILFSLKFKQKQIIQI